MIAHTHNCAARACQKQVPLNLLMCMTHWKMVPAPVQRTVLTAWRLRLRRGECESVVIEQHAAACAAAVDAVHAKQHRKLAEKAVRDGALFEV